jgi:hypothetical protein
MSSIVIATLGSRSMGNIVTQKKNNGNSFDNVGLGNATIGEKLQDRDDDNATEEQPEKEGGGYGNVCIGYAGVCRGLPPF